MSGHAGDALRAAVTFRVIRARERRQRVSFIGSERECQQPQQVGPKSSREIGPEKWELAVVPAGAEPVSKKLYGALPAPAHRIGGAGHPNREHVRSPRFDLLS